ncbi:MAG TPA: Ig-like domain repeat protein, partial [Marmoricola sp.]
AAWATGWSWTYGNTSFHYQSSDGTDVTLNESVTYTVAGQQSFNGNDAYKLTLSGSITGCNGSANASGTTVTIKNCSGSVSGTRFVRRSDLALLQESQQQHLDGSASYSIFTIGITADINLQLTPTPGWKVHDFPLNSGDGWNEDFNVAYTGGFSYSSSLASGSSPFDGNLHFDGPASVSNANVTVGSTNVATKRVHANSNADAMTDDSYWSPAYKNDAKETLVLPLDGATLTLNRTLTSASIGGGNSLTATASPSYTCAGDTVTVSGSLSTLASGVAVTARLDQSSINPGQGTSASTTTGANGVYSVTLPVPADSDGFGRTGSQPSRANWGVLVTAPSANAVGATTVVVSSQDCSTIAYTGPSSGAQFGGTTVTAKLTDVVSAGGAAGRTVTFTLAGGSSVNATTDPSGVATATLPIAGPPRSTTITAAFSGASNLAAATTTVPFTVTKASTSTTVAPSSSTVTIGDPVTFTASVASAPGTTTQPSGTVQFKVDGSDFGAAQSLAGGSATSQAFNTGLLSIGNHTVQAVYSGDADYLGSTSSSVTFRVRNPLLPTTTTGTATPSSVVFGQTVTLSADVAKGSGTDAVTGSVTFTDGATPLGTATVDGSGHAQLDVSTLAVGGHSIVAAYSGDDVYNASSSAPSAVTVAKADVTVDLTTADDTTVTGEAVNLTAHVSALAPGEGTPTGTVQLVVDGNDVGSPVTLVGGSAAFGALTTLGAGDHTLAVSYGGDASFRTGTDSLTQHVAMAGTSTSLVAGPSPSSEDQPVTITASVVAQAPGSGAPTGTVVFTADGDVIGAAPLVPGGGGSQASLDVSTLAPGAHTLAASYAGDGDFLGSESADLSHTVIEGAAVVATTTTVTSSDNPSTYGELIAFTATVAAEDGSTPTGSVQFSLDGVDFGDPVDLDADGVAVSLTLASPDPGDHTVIAAYLPPAAYAGSGAILTQTVTDAGADVALESSGTPSDYGQPVTFTATVSSGAVGTGTPTGFVQFSVDGTPLGDAVAVDEDGVAHSPSVSDLAPGSHAVTALYSGDTHFGPTTASLSQDVEKVATTTTLVASTTSPTFGDAVQLTATVTPGQTAFGAPGGTVTFRDGSTTLATVPVSADGTTATASISRSDLGAGSHAIVAEYAGTPVFAASASAPVTVTVGKQATSLHADALLIRANPLIGLNVGVVRAVLTSASGPLAGRTVVFTNGATTLCAATTDANGLATCQPSLVNWLTVTLAGKFTAAYAGEANYQGSTDVGKLIQ